MVYKIISLTGQMAVETNKILARGLKLFAPQRNGIDTRLLTDNPGELVRIRTDVLVIDGRTNIWEMLKSPVVNADILNSRVQALRTINSLKDGLYEKLYATKATAMRLFSFEEAYENWDDLRNAIKDLEADKYRGKDDAYSQIFLMPATSLDDARLDIHKHIMLIRQMPGEFFKFVADDLYEAFEKARKFSLQDLKKIYETKDRKAFSELKRNIENFCGVFSRWDSVLILAEWIKSGYLKPSENTNGSTPEQAFNVFDFRPLLYGDYRRYYENVPNDINPGKTLEVFCGGNGSGKSTWLKTRLGAQLLHQNFLHVNADSARMRQHRQIIYINRGGSGYGEDLSAFGNDIQNKLLSFLPDLQNDAMIFLDEFGSTIPEQEAYFLKRALMDYLLVRNAKIFSATHNELYIKWLNRHNRTDFGLYHPLCAHNNGGDIVYTYKLKEGADSAHTFNVFRMVGMPDEIINRAVNYSLRNQSPLAKMVILSQPIEAYTSSEREQKKQEIAGFMGLSRLNEMVRNEQGWILRLYQPLDYKEKPARWFPDQDIFHQASHPPHLSKLRPKLQFDFFSYSGDEKIMFPSQLFGKYSHLNVWDSTLCGLTSWGLTNNTAELLEKQKFFDELTKIPFEEADKIYNEANMFRWVVNLYFDRRYKKEFDFDLKDMYRFNHVCWDEFIANLTRNSQWYGPGRLIDWFMGLMEIEKALGVLPPDFELKHQKKLEKIHKTADLISRIELAQIRSSQTWNEKYQRSAKTAKKIEEKLMEELQTLWPKNLNTLLEQIKAMAKTIRSQSVPIDVLALDTQKRREVTGLIEKYRIFREKLRRHESDSEYPEKGAHAMLQIIRAIKGEGNLLKPLIKRLKELDSVHAQRLANYLDENFHCSDVEEFIKVLNINRDIGEGEKEYLGELYSGDDKLLSPVFEFLGILHIAHQIRKQGWAKVKFNNTGEIDIKGMYHPAVEKSGNEQVKTDFQMSPTTAFDILEGATMGGKTFQIQEVYWAFRLAHSLGYVPADYADIPAIDGIVYIDRILEDEKNRLSAGQNDAATWTKIINNVRGKIRDMSARKHYWFAIDEMLSSVPRRYQQGLVISILEELKALGQRGQISMHNPELVSLLLELDPEAYTVHHPQIELNADGGIEKYTYRIVPGRSLDREGNHSAFSLETAEKMGLPAEIIESARNYRKSHFQEESGNVIKISAWQKAREK
ncbi:MAG: hypothetical protein PHV30_04100 [Candidatus Margulisbacteria bacterium]|nr:hypothetical protein [Candidatus Margulisiibacteriota bacterium]